MSRTRNLTLILLSLALISAYGQQKSWIDYGGGTDSSHYVESKQITKANVGQLEVAWSFDTQEPGGLQTSPIIVDGLIALPEGNSNSRRTSGILNIWRLP